LGDELGGLDAGDQFLFISGKGAEMAFNLDSVPKFFGLPEKGPETHRDGRGEILNVGF
jgi:hypothetical protein